MNDYKELIEILRGGYVVHEDYNGEPEIMHRPSAIDKEAADAIEQLVKERDAAVADISVLAENRRDVCVICEQNFGDTSCFSCGYLDLNKNFKWRGTK